MKSNKTAANKSNANPLQAIPVLKCSFLVPTEDRKGIFLITNDRGRESVFQVDGFGGEFCQRIDGDHSSEEIADEMIQKHELPEPEFKEYVTALQKDLRKNGILTFQRS